MEEYYENRANQELIKDLAPRIKQKIKEKKEVLKELKDIKTNKKKSKLLKFVDKLGRSKLSNKRILKKEPHATVIVNQPVYTQDKSRFFKEAWEEEKKQLYFK